jgi:hypothetical protein
MTVRTFTATVQYCDACVKAASAATDTDGKPIDYLVADGTEHRGYFLIRILTDESTYVTPEHRCEAPQVCECPAYHDDRDEDEGDEDDEEQEAET